MSAKSVLLEFVREEDFVEYFLFPQLTDSDDDCDKIQNDLQNILEQVNQLVKTYNRDYIWHKDEFLLTIRTQEHRILIEENDEKKEFLPPHLYGISHYGENIQDEWFIVFLIFEITRKIPGIIGRVVDADGEFLLIEAADVLPKWANPDTCEQRTYIHNGYLQLVQNSPSNTSALLPISTAVGKIWQNSTLYRVSPEIQTCIYERLKDFNEEQRIALHHQIVRVPFAISEILKQKPSLIAPACRAFCERDSIDMKACRAMRYFPPENRIKTNVKFTRCLYAMMLNNNYIPDRNTGWNLPSPDSQNYKEDILGVKIACGFEILALQAKQEDDIENDRAWKLYMGSLQKKDYFRDLLEGSKDYCRLLNDAKIFYKENRDRFRTASIIGQEILHLLRNIEINTEQLKADESNLRPSDNDSWLNISAEELDEILNKKYGITKLYKMNGNLSASEFTKNISEFLEKKSEYDGVDISTSPSNRVKKTQSMRKAIEKNSIINDTELVVKSNDQQINFDPDAFQTHVKNFLDFVIPEDNWESGSEMSDYEDDDDIDRNIEGMENAEYPIKTDIKVYMDQMDRELARTTIGKTFETTLKKHKDSSYKDDFDDIESFTPIDINVNTLKNMMDSYKSQIGGPGPTSNLLGAMGIGMTTTTKKNDNDKDADDNLPDINGTQV